MAGATLTVTASGTAVPYNWNSPLGVEPGTLVANSYSGTVRNDSDNLPAQNVRVFGVRRQGGIIVDAAGSARSPTSRSARRPPTRLPSTTSAARPSGA